MSKPTPSLLIFLLIAKAALLGVFIDSGSIGLGPDEAQYWTWSRNLDYGYYSKPPAVAWQIALGTFFFGGNELGVRAMSLLIGFCLPLAVYLLAKECQLTSYTAFFAALAMALSPLGIMSSLLATTDGGMVLFWTLASAVAARGFARQEVPHYYLLGFLVLCGALFKWPIYLFWPLLVVFLPFFPQLRSRHLIGGIAVSLLGLAPSLWWNMQHDFATFRHVLGNITGAAGHELGTTPLTRGNFWEFLGAQASLLSPLLFLLLLLALIDQIKNRKERQPQLLFCSGMTLLLLTAYSLISLKQKMQGNWCVFAYPTGIVSLTWYAKERVHLGKLWLCLGMAVSVCLTGGILAVPFLQSRELVAIPYKHNPFRHNIGWQAIDEGLSSFGYDPGKHFLFSDKYQTTSILSFYAPGKQQAYFFNLEGVRKNQFSYWPSMKEREGGNTGFFVIYDNEPQLARLLEQKVPAAKGALAHYFDEVEYLGMIPLFRTGSRVVKGAAVFKCTGYNQRAPQDPEIY